MASDVSSRARGPRTHEEIRKKIICLVRGKFLLGEPKEVQSLK